jgi:mercuric ion transport protein
VSLQTSTEKPTGLYQTLTAGLLVSVTASICCLGPFALLATGVSGAWMSRLMIFEPLQPLLIVVTALLFALAGWKLFYARKTIVKGGSCSIQLASTQQKTLFFVAGILSIILLSSEYWIVFLAT